MRKIEPGIKAIMVRFPRDLLIEGRKHALDQDISFNAFMVGMLEKEMKKLNKQKQVDTE